MPMVLHLLAAATSDDVFKSMNAQMSEEVNPVQVLLVIAGFVGICVLLSVFKKRQDRPAAAAEVNNPSKLLRQMAREAGLKKREVKELKKLAEIAGVDNALTLLLCPSLMQAAITKLREGVTR